MLRCEVCDGPLMLLGTLGWTAHLRCQDCGDESTVDARLLDTPLGSDYVDDEDDDY